MHHFVRDWMKSPIIVVDPDSSVSHALTLMRRRGIHSLVVGLENSYGIVTSTDIRDKIIAPNRNPADTQVSTIMTARGGMPLAPNAPIPGGGNRPNSTGTSAFLTSDRSRNDQINRWFD
ncbi:MAG TPA: CBS domain-containing protein, partial [Anaerolineales bacterium]|nr:CBS domain-containing protein [Anaerolineales bacterium]